VFKEPPVVGRTSPQTIQAELRLLRQQRDLLEDQVQRYEWSMAKDEELAQGAGNGAGHIPLSPQVCSCACLEFVSGGRLPSSIRLSLLQARQKNLAMLEELRLRQDALKDKHCRLLQVSGGRASLSLG
jgi:hypothetical protein